MDRNSDDMDILEVSPYGRWQRHDKPLKQRLFPGIMSANLATDTHTGMEVSWNKVQLDDPKKMDSINAILTKSMALFHNHLITVHDFWTTGDNVINVITEYLPFGNLKQFLHTTRTRKTPPNSWMSWCGQLLSALSYIRLETCHGGFSFSTSDIYINDDGHVKLSCVTPGITFHETFPQAGLQDSTTTEVPARALDMYCLEGCVLEMVTTKTVGSSQDCMQQALNTLGNGQQRDLIAQCLHKTANRCPEMPQCPRGSKLSRSCSRTEGSR
jgi:hypothetical protein